MVTRRGIPTVQLPLVVAAVFSIILACDYQPPPEAPEAPVITELIKGDRKVLIQWAPLEVVINEYRVYYGIGTLSKNFSAVLTSGGSTSSQTIDGLTNGIEYNFAMVAVADSGESPLSEVRTATPAETPPQDRAPDPPRDVVATLGFSEIFVSWIPPSDTGIVNGDGTPGTINEYSVYVSKTAIDTGRDNPLFVPEERIILTGLDDGVSYNIAVAAVNQFGEGTPSEVKTVSPSPSPGDEVPGRPKIMKATAEVNQIVLEWEAPVDTGIDGGQKANITEYKVYASQATIDTLVVTPRTVTMPGPLEMTIPDLTGGTPYNFALKAVNAIGVGPLSISKAATPLSIPPDRAPGRPTITGATPGDGQVVLEWEAPADPGIIGGNGTPGTIIRYVIFATPWYLAGSTSKWTTASGNLGETTVRTLVNGISYSFTVVAENAHGRSEPSMPKFSTPSP